MNISVDGNVMNSAVEIGINCDELNFEVELNVTFRMGTKRR